MWWYKQWQTDHSLPLLVEAMCFQCGNGGDPHRDFNIICSRLYQEYKGMRESIVLWRFHQYRGQVVQCCPLSTLPLASFPGLSQFFNVNALKKIRGAWGRGYLTTILYTWPYLGMNLVTPYQLTLQRTMSYHCSLLKSLPFTSLAS